MHGRYLVLRAAVALRRMVVLYEQSDGAKMAYVVFIL
jgi:hypothetical protein